MRTRKRHAVVGIAVAGIAIAMIVAVSAMSQPTEDRRTSKSAFDASAQLAEGVSWSPGPPRPNENPAPPPIEVESVDAAKAYLSFTPKLPNLPEASMILEVPGVLLTGPDSPSSSSDSDASQAIFQASISTDSGEFDLREYPLLSDEDPQSILELPPVGFDSRFMKKVTIGGNPGVAYGPCDIPPQTEKDGTIIPGVQLQAAEVAWVDGGIVYRSASLDYSTEELVEMLGTMYE